MNYIKTLTTIIFCILILPLISIYPLNSVPENMVFIPGGAFKMGQGSTNVGGYEASVDEQPVHWIYLDSFYISIYEVTNQEFKDFIIANPDFQKESVSYSYQDGHYLENWAGNYYENGKANHPVNYISWYIAVSYCNWLSVREGLEKVYDNNFDADITKNGYRLLTETEWEYLAIGIDGRKYPWGDTISKEYANYYTFVDEENPPATKPVGSYEMGKSYYGVYDLTGNVSEWCTNEYASYPEGITPLPKIYKHNKENLKSYRGGSFLDPAVKNRSRDRKSFIPTICSETIGFRIARSYVF